MIVNPSIKYKEQNPVYHFTDQFVNLIFYSSWVAANPSIKCEGPKIQYNSPADVITENNWIIGVFVENSSFTGYTMTVSLKLLGYGSKLS